MKNNELARVFECLFKLDKNNRNKLESLLGNFHFVFTRGTFDRLMLGKDEKNIEDKQKRIKMHPTTGRIPFKELNKHIYTMNEEVRDFILIPDPIPKGNHSHLNVTVLPSHSNGGIIHLSNLIIQKQCNILWSFYSPVTEHWMHPEAQSLLRLCDLYNVKRLMNAESVRAWFLNEAQEDVKLNRQEIPLTFKLGTSTDIPAQFRLPKASQVVEVMPGGKNIDYFRLKLKDIRNPKDWSLKPDNFFDFDDKTLVLVASDDMIDEIVDFSFQYEEQLNKFKRILATETTGTRVEKACRLLAKNKKIIKCLSSIRGGTIEIATEILLNRCDIIIFFSDPLIIPPHRDDIQVVLGACMAEIEGNNVRILTNELQARKWMEGVIRGQV